MQIIHSVKLLCYTFKMTEFSTPIRQKSGKCLLEPLPEITPIKSYQKTKNEFQSFDLFDNFLANETSLFEEGKRKPENDDSDRSRSSISNSFQLKKQRKIEIAQAASTSLLDNQTTCANRSIKNVTSGVDLFEEEILNDGNLFSCVKLDNNKENVKVEVSADIIENSVLKSVDVKSENELLNLNVIDKAENNIFHDPKDNLKQKSCEDINEDSCELNLSLRDNSVVDQILEKMNVESEVTNFNSPEKNDNQIQNIALNGFSQILMESVMNWEKQLEVPDNSEDIQKVNNMRNVSLADKVKQKLLNNVNNMKIVKPASNGWSQMEASLCNFDDSILENSKYHELGPFFGLPSKVQALYEEHKGIKELYCWQKECLTLKAVKEKKNLVYSLPTSGGKTLVAEILILRELLCYNHNVLFILPFVSIVQEKVHDLSIFALELGFLVEEYAAGKGVLPLRKRRKRRSVIVATIEKASAVIISLIETKQLDEFGLLVVDELHLISEESGRGSTLESLLTLVLHLGEKIQIIGMTATIGNLNEIAKFLRAEAFTGTFRPIELQEFVKCGNDVFAVNWDSEDILKLIRSIKSPNAGSDPDGISELVLELVPNDSVLIFCPTKRNCENVALLIAEIMPKYLKNFKEEEKLSFLKALQSETNNQICPVLQKTIPYGVVYHHSGLTTGERKLLEEAFRSGTLCIICCTSTLAAGVNLPAARVILRSPYIGKDFISLSKYKQMIGRAGRAGMGSRGESYLMCQPCDSEKIGILLRSKMDDCISKMNIESLKSLILSSIGLGIATSRGELRTLVNCTLLSLQAETLGINLKKLIDLCISSLFKMGAIKVKDFEQIEENDESKLDITIKRMDKKFLKITNNSCLSISRLGCAAMKGCIGLERAHELYADLIKAQAALVLLTELHLLYLVCPYEMLDQIKPNYSVYFNVYMQLSAKETPAAKTIGVTEFVISKLATGMKPKNIPVTTLHRFYIALILNEMLKQQNIWNVAKMFQITGGMVQTLMTSTSTFANNVLRFCEELSELWSFKCLLSDFAPRLAHCCSAELIPLLELPAVKRGRAKQLYNAGFKTLNILANADVNHLVKSIDHLPRRVATQIVAAARLLLLEKAENLKEEAEEVLMGLAGKIVQE